MKGKIKRIRELKHKARRKSIGEGVFAAARSSLGNYYTLPFAIAINSSNAMVAMFSSVSGILGPLSQMFSSKLIGKYSRKKIVTRTVLYESLTWLLFILVAFLYIKDIITNILLVIFLLFFSLNVMISNSITPAWFSWHGDIVDKKFRGRWFSKRNLITDFVSVVLAIMAAFALDYFKSSGHVMLGFGILFFLAFSARISSWKMFSKMYEPKIKVKKENHFSFSDFIIKSGTNNFGKFTIFRGMLEFATFIYWPLITIYLVTSSHR